MGHSFSGVVGVPGVQPGQLRQPVAAEKALEAAMYCARSHAGRAPPHAAAMQLLAQCLLVRARVSRQTVLTGHDHRERGCGGPGRGTRQANEGSHTVIDLHYDSHPFLADIQAAYAAT